jgi:aldose 1-epimerase
VHNLPLTEPATATAAHGLVAWLDFTPVEQSADRLVLRARVEPQPGYPWRVRIDVVFELTEGGFRQIVTATNESAERAPIGLGVHPYLLAGGGDEQGHPVGALDDWRLTLPAREVMLVSEDRMLPVGMARVDEHDAGALDFRHGRRIGSTQLNHAFTALEPDPDGWATIAVENAQGSGVELWWNARAPWVQVYSSDYQPPATRRQGIAIEPMTCPPDAFNSRVDLRVVPGGSDTSLEWGSRAI